MTSIDLPVCPKCQSDHMLLARVLPGFGGASLQSFKCPKCDHIHKVLIEGRLRLDNLSPNERDSQNGGTIPYHGET